LSSIEPRIENGYELSRAKRKNNKRKKKKEGKSDKDLEVGGFYSFKEPRVSL
jgi:hypothetical protein